MYYVYILFSKKDQKTYVGYTSNIKNRFKKHNTGEVKSTKNRIPLICIHLECFLSMSLAKERELWFKTSYGRKYLGKIYDSFLKEKLIEQ